MRVPWNSDRSDGTWRQVAVYGLGLSGRAAVRLLRARGVRVVAFDGRTADQLGAPELLADPGVRLVLGAEPTDLPEDLSWARVDGVVVSPGVPSDRPLLAAARRAGKPVIAEVELAFPFLGGEVIAVTGSNGKSTTTAMAGAMLEAAGLPVRVCGNIGEPLCDCAPAPDAVEAPAATYVVELSSFQLEAVDRFRPRAAALLNLSVDHLDRHADFAAYRDAKLAIFRRQQPGDVAVINADDPRVMASTGDLAARRRLFSRVAAVDDGCFLDGGDVLEVAPDLDHPRPLFVADDVPLPGPHNLENAMAAALLARTRGVEPAAVARGLRDFRGLPHRLEKVRELGGVTYFDDSKGTNLAATLRSLEGFDDGRVVIILGGRFKGGDLAELAELVARKARRALLIGESARTFADALEASPGAPPFEHAGTLERAVARAADAAQSGDVVLLSPACSSFDQFPNFAERGRSFQRLVRALGGGGHGP